MDALEKWQHLLEGIPNWKIAAQWFGSLVLDVGHQNCQWGRTPNRRPGNTTIRRFFREGPIVFPKEGAKCKNVTGLVF